MIATFTFLYWIFPLMLNSKENICLISFHKYFFLFVKNKDHVCHFNEAKKISENAHPPWAMVQVNIQKMLKSHRNRRKLKHR